MEVRDGLRRTMGRWFAGTWDDGPGDSAHGQAVAGRTGDPPTCDLCGRRLLLGERLGRVRDGERVVAACPVCAAEALRAGCVRVAGGHDGRWWTASFGHVSRLERLPDATARGVGADPAREADVVAVPRAGRRDRTQRDRTQRDGDGSGEVAA